MQKHITLPSIITFLLLILLISCSTDRYPRVLVESDHLIDTRPDSALHLLNSIKERMSREPLANQMYWKLLTVKASDKMSRPMCTPGEITEIVEYFIGEGNKELLPEAYYYAGRVFRTYNDAPEARRYFISGIEAIDKSSSPGDFTLLKGKCLSQLGSIYLYQDLCEEAVSMYQKAFKISHETNDTIHMIYNLRDAANAYLSMAKPDSSLIYIDSGIRLSKELRDSLFLNELYLLKSAAEIEHGDYIHAREDFDKAAKLVNGKPTIAYYTIGARLAYATGDTAECTQMAHRMLDEGNLHDKRWASRILAELTLANNNPHEALKLIKEYIALDDSVSKIDRACTILKMNALYDYSIREAENAILKAKNVRLAWLFWSAIALLTSLSATAIFYIRYKRQQHSLMKLKIEKLESLRIESGAKDSDKVKFEKDSIEASEIYKEINLLINSPGSHTRLTDKQWKEIATVVKKTYPDFEKRLLSLCRMNDNEMKVCLLLKMGYAPTIIANLTCHSKESVSATRRRLFEKAFGQKKATPRDWDDFINTL